MAKRTTEVVPHPGLELARRMEQYGISAYRLAKATRIGAPSVGKIVSGELGITPLNGRRLDRFFGDETGYWSNIQLQYELARVEREKANDLAAVTPLSEASPRPH